MDSGRGLFSDTTAARGTHPLAHGASRLIRSEQALALVRPGVSEGASTGGKLEGQGACGWIMTRQAGRRGGTHSSDQLGGCGTQFVRERACIRGGCQSRHRRCTSRRAPVRDVAKALPLEDEHMHVHMWETMMNVFSMKFACG